MRIIRVLAGALFIVALFAWPVILRRVDAIWKKWEAGEPLRVKRSPLASAGGEA